MPSTPRSRRNRNSTLKSVDLLNSVNQSTSTTNLPRPRSRKINNKEPSAPRSGDVFDVPPSSPEAIRASRTRGTLNSAPVTRHSTRIQTRSRSVPNANKESQQGSRSPEVRIFLGAPNIEGPGQQSAGSSLGEDESPPISELLDQNTSNIGEVSEVYVDAREVAYGNADETSTVNGLQEVVSEDEADDPSAERDGAGKYGEDDRAYVPDSNSPTEGSDTSSPASSIRKRKLSAMSREPQDSPEAESDQDDSNDVNWEEPEIEASSDGGEVSESDFNEQPQRRPRAESHPRPAIYVEITNRRRTYPMAAVRNKSGDSPRRYETSSPEEPQHSSPPQRNSRKPSVIAESIAGAEWNGAEEDGGGEGEAEEEEAREHGARESGPRENEVRQDDPERVLFEEARTLGDQKENWKIFFKQTKMLRKRADISMSSSFNAPLALISELQDTYTRMRVRLSEGDRISSKSIRGCENLLRGISTEAVQILDAVWRLSTEGPEDRAQDLLYGFETLVVPPMASLVGHCFLTYYVGQSRFPKRHLHRVMTLLYTLLDRIFHQIMSQAVKTKMLSKKLRLALRRLISALDSGSLNLKPSIPSRIDKRARPFSLLEDYDAGTEYFPEVEAPLTTREWTDDEGKALVEGLQRYQGPDRYVEIVRHYGTRLRDRTIYELRAKAQEVRDNFLPMADDLLSSSEGRRKMQWLLSV